MASLKMQATANTKGFTLVELIVVITILAILGTIGFISLQGYSAQSRDSKRTSDLRSLSTAVTTKNTEGLNLISMVTTDAARDLSTPSVWGAATSATTYQGGIPNATVLGINADNFKDPNKNVAYSIGATTKAGGAFQLAASLESGGTNWTPALTGNFNSRGTTTKALSVLSASGSSIITLVDDAVGHFKRDDVVTFSAGPTGSYTIGTVSGDGKTITFKTVLNNPAAAAATIQLAAAETLGLIDSLTINTPVTSTGTVLPY